MLDDQTLVSVILLTEDAADDDVFNVFKNITEQTHKKIDIIVSTFRAVSYTHLTLPTSDLV